ncbi:MAG: hypothetical protein Q4C04_04150 [Clostridia bacterium]|nr:hypothetical protein [Clostridia bacterium]
MRNLHMPVRRGLALIFLAALLCCCGCSGGEDVEPSAAPTMQIYDPKDASTDADESLPQWLEVENALLYRAALNSPARENVFGLYYEAGDGYAELAVDFDYITVEPCVEPVSLLICDLDAEDGLLNLALCVKADESSYATYVFSYEDGSILCLWEGEGELQGVEGNVLLLNVDGVLTERAV